MVWVGLILMSVILLGEDKVWTPTFGGDQWSRFGHAMAHYHDKMGLQDKLVFRFGVPRVTELEIKENWCASVELGNAAVPGFEPDEEVVLVRYFGDHARPCNGNKPEILALHEACHLRLMHHKGALGSLVEKKEREVRQCMRWYSAKERR